DVARKPGISANAAVNLGLTLARLKKYDEANLWFTRAIVEDEGNAAGQRGKAYRNLGITLRNQDRHLAAAVAVAFAYQDKAPNVDLRMIRAFFENADKQEVARVLHFQEAPPKLAPRGRATDLTPAAAEGAFTEPVTELLPDPQGRYVLAWTAGEHYYLLDTRGK